MNRRQRKKKKAQVFTIILGCTAFCKAEQYEKMRKSVEYQLRTGSVVMLPAYLHVEAIIKQRGGRNIEIKQESEAVENDEYITGYNSAGIAGDIFKTGQTGREEQRE